MGEMRIEKEGQKTMGIWKKDIVDEAKRQLWIAMPMTLVGLFTFSLPVISVMFVGQLGELQLSGAALATSFANVFGFIVLMGMGSALDTFFGQSYGAKQYHMLGIHMQRAMLVLLVVTIPQSIIWANLRPILIAMHQDPEISAEAEAYGRYMIPSLSAYALLQCCVKFLQNQNIAIPMVFTSGFTCLVHVFICCLFVIKIGIGSKGAAIAACISDRLDLILLIPYIKFSSSCKALGLAFQGNHCTTSPNFSGFLFLQQSCSESILFELVVLLSGILPNPKLQTSVLSVCINTSFIFWMISFGFSAAASTRISNELGAGFPKAAYLAFKVNLGMAFIEGAISFMILILIRNVWARAFTNVEEVIEYIKSMMPMLAAIAFLDAIQATLLGFVRGCGLQKFGAFVNLGSYYLVGIPCSVVHMKGKGLWLGVILALLVQMLCLIVIALCPNWENEAKNAAKRSSGTAVQLDTQAEPWDQRCKSSIAEGT